MNDFDPEVHCSGIFDRLDKFTPEQRAHLFFALECRWCWHCGQEQWSHEADCPAFQAIVLKT